MEQMQRGDQLISFDKTRTAAAYASLRRGGCGECGCSHCLNFAAQREKAYPQEFRLMLASLGIDWAKEGEAYECGAVEGLHLYGGWFYLAGKVLEPGERLSGADGDFQYYFADAGYLPKPSANFGASVAAIEFYTRLPWVLQEEP